METTRLTARAVGLEKPADGLEAVAALRRRLGELERLHVENARRVGMSWAELAGVTGVSKQALHRKHAGELADGRRPRPAPFGDADERHVVVTGEARDVVYFARQEATALGHEPVGTGHLLLGMLRQNRGAAARALRELNVSIGAVRLHVDRLVTARRVIPAADEPNRPVLPVSQAARRVLEQSLHESLRLGDQHLGPEHVLLALLSEPHSVAGRTLAALHIRGDAVEAQLEGIRSSRNVRAGA